MRKFFINYQKRIAVLFALLLFVIAAGYTSYFSLTKSITIEIDERLTSSSHAQVNTISHVNLNKTLGEVLDEFELPIDENYESETDLSTKIRDIDTVKINRKVNGVLQVDGDNINFDSGAETVGDLLGEYDVKLSPSDIVTPTVDTNLTMDNATIVINRQNQQRETREETIPFDTTQTEDRNLRKGLVEIDIPGMDGKKIVVEDVLYKDGVAVERNLVSEEILLPATTQVQRLGLGVPNTTYSATNTTGNSIPSTSTSTPSSGTSTITGNINKTNLSDSDFDLICAVVEHEGGSSYESALAVMSCVMNRVDSPSYPNDPVSVLTAPGQFESYFAGYYRQFLNNHSSGVVQAVTDCLNGKRNHNYLSFRGYQTSGSEKIGDNWFFNE